MTTMTDREWDQLLRDDARRSAETYGDNAVYWIDDARFWDRQARWWSEHVSPRDWTAIRNVVKCERFADLRAEWAVESTRRAARAAERYLLMSTP